MLLLLVHLPSLIASKASKQMIPRQKYYFTPDDYGYYYFTKRNTLSLQPQLQYMAIEDDLHVDDDTSATAGRSADGTCFLLDFPFFFFFGTIVMAAPRWAANSRDGLESSREASAIISIC